MGAPDVPVSSAYITGPNGEGRTLIKPLSEYSGFTAARGINEAGQVAGHSLAVSPTGEGRSHAFITGPNGIGTIDLGFAGSAADINNKGQAAGEVFGGFSTHAFITGSNGTGITDLGNLGGSGFVSEINDSGRVVGGFETAPGSRHAFITGPNGQGMIDLGTLGGSFSSAADINEAGQVVGSSDTATGSRHAFVTGPYGTGMTDLNSLVDLPKGVILSNATGINNVGQVIAIAAMIPEPSSYALMLAGLALVGMVIRRREVL